MKDGAARSPLIAAAAAALIAFTVYVLTLAPTVSGEDSGEFITAAWSAGIPHPPSYPLYVDIGHLFTWLPLGDVAWRVNLMSAFFGAAAIGALSLLSFRFTGSAAVAFSAPLAFAFSREFWEQAVIAEVYTLNAFLLCLCVLLLWQWRASAKAGWLYAFAAVYGLSLANHPTMAVLGPVFAVAVLGLEPVSVGRWRRYGACAAIAGAIALALYGQIYFRSLANPPVDWGNPETVANWWRVVQREQYAFMVTEHPRSWARLGQQLRDTAHDWGAQWGWLLGALCVAGHAVLFRRHRFWCVFFWALALVASFSALAMQNPSPDKEWRWVMSVFGIPLYLVTSLGFSGVLQWIESWSGRRAVAGVAGVMVALLLAGRHWEANDKSDYYWVEDFAGNVLRQLPEEAIFIPESDHESFPLFYYQHVKGMRPGVSVGRKYGHLETGILPGMRERFAAYGAFPRRRYEPEMIAWVVAHAGCPVFTTKPVKIEDFVPWHFVQCGLLYEAVPLGATPAQQAWPKYVWRNGIDGDARGDYTAELIQYQVCLAHAREAFTRGDTEAGLSYVSRAMAAYGEDPRTLNQAAILCAEHGLKGAAEDYFVRALELEPRNATVAKNLARLRARGT
ncbi:MAG: DUF2723 domain-containing protein [Candidatus Hydrogenedentes bacterium]|nr:DUF2723 domain-containing protein [Candidatus Hydrogenedentota bacterium]